MIGKTEASCRQMVHRSKERITTRRRRFEPSQEETERITSQFLKTAQDGDVAGLMALFAADAVMISDGGGKVRAALNPVRGPSAIARFVMAALYPTGQESVEESSAAQILETMPQIEAKADRVFMRSYGNMVPATCTPASVERLKQAKAASAGLSEGVRRDIVSSLESDQRCVATRAKFEGSL